MLMLFTGNRETLRSQGGGAIPSKAHYRVSLHFVPRNAVRPCGGPHHFVPLLPSSRQSYGPLRYRSRTVRFEPLRGCVSIETPTIFSFLHYHFVILFFHLTLKGALSFMASFHFSLKTGKVGNGSRHAQYICREGVYSFGPKAEELIYKEHGNMPYWSKDDPQDFWKACDEYERANGRAYTEFEIDLPNELNQEQQIALVKDFVKKNLGDKHTYSFAIHTKEAALDKSFKNPHAHIMFTERKLDGIERSREQFFKRYNPKKPELGGTRKDRNWTHKETPYRLRLAWANTQNKHLEMHGHSVRVDPRTLKEQLQEAIEKGDMERAELLNRIPEKHLGPNVANRVLRDLAEYTKHATNPQDKMRLMVQYYTELEPNEKAQSVFLIREMKKTMNQITRINRQLSEAEKKASIEKTKLTLRELGAYITERQRFINSELPKYYELRSHLKKNIYSDKRIMAAAKAKYLKTLAERNQYSYSVGKLIEHGPANFNFDPNEKLNYYVKLQDNKGNEKVIWGVDLPRAFAESQVKPGQEIVIENLGRKPVTIDAPVYDSNGKFLHTEKKEVLRNEWKISDMSNLKNIQERILNTPEAQDQIQKFYNSINEKMKPLRENLEKTEYNIMLLKQERTSITKIRGLMTFYTDRLDKPIEITGDAKNAHNISKQLSQINSQLKSAVGDIKRSEARVKGKGMKVKLRGSESVELKGEHNRKDNELEY